MDYGNNLKPKPQVKISALMQALQKHPNWKQMEQLVNEFGEEGKPNYEAYFRGGPESFDSDVGLPGYRIIGGSKPGFYNLEKQQEGYGSPKLEQSDVELSKVVEILNNLMMSNPVFKN